MKASFYHEIDDPITYLLSKYTETIPIKTASLADLDWIDDPILFTEELEDISGFEFDNNQLESFFDGTMKVAEMVDLFTMKKIAKITSQSDRARMRSYRMKNKAELARKAKIRRRKTKQGVHRVKKRIGTAAGGYSFIEKPTNSTGAKTRVAGQIKSTVSYKHFKPVVSSSTTRLRKLDKK